MITRPFPGGPGRSRRRRNQEVDETVAPPWRRGPVTIAFTLLELLVVIAIMGIVAAVSLPAIKSWNRSNVTTSASRQLLDDLALARQTAISRRCTVYVVFSPPDWRKIIGKVPPLQDPPFLSEDLPMLTNLLTSPYASYALFATRQVGDQPNATNAQYLSNWKTLPEGTFIATNKFDGFTGNPAPGGIFPPPPVFNGVRAFASSNGLAIPYPSSTSKVVFGVPAIAFDYQGRLTCADGSREDAVIPLARGTIYPARGVSGRIIATTPAISENPPFNSINQSNHIRVDFLTGRARVEKWEMP